MPLFQQAKSNAKHNIAFALSSDQLVHWFFAFVVIAHSEQFNFCFKNTQLKTVL